MHRLIIILFLINSSISIAAITRQEYDMARQLILDNYTDELKQRNISLLIRDMWNKENFSTMSNAYRALSIQVSGDYARLPKMTYDGFVLLLCHELGHGVSYAPANSFDPIHKLGSSHEGQADYFATLKCFKKVFKNENKKIENSPLPQRTVSECQEATQNEQEFNLCKRGMLASVVFVSNIKSNEAFSLIDKDPNILYYTESRHPNPQCRLDTLKAGLLCPVNEDLSMFDAFLGTCHSKRYPKYARPECWFNEEDDRYAKDALIIKE